MKQIMTSILLAGSTLFMTFALISYPDQALEASLRGLNVWLEKVFPSLLPFFITAELLIAFGVVKFIGVLCEPIMRPLFNVPGVGSFAWAMGMASGYPTGAKITVRLREEKQITKIEGERLVSFTNASSPLFIFGVVAAGFFLEPKLGLLLALAHYGGNTIVGICMRFYGRHDDEKEVRKEKQKVSILRAFKEMHSSRLADPRPFGEVFGDAVLNSIKTLVMVGGFIIIFSVFIKLLYIIGLSPIIASALQFVLHLLSLPIELALPLFSGLFEITIGSRMITEAVADPLLAKVIAVSFILGFNGFSIQAQVASILAKSDVRFFPYFFARILHGLFASILVLLLYKPLYLDQKALNLRDNLPVTGNIQEGFWQITLETLQAYGPIVTIFSLTLAFLILLRRQLLR
ncbi:sporulation integral membrane protein YlbJ [Virgibacillus necropolis]|uniref:Sporulation integral membrane protein YlbJ n=1 Tax=Virgibacillus necropolis TaxID=163877 RepID=A0A221MDV4_9BACI|nr:sporulation integral membrane protein YlbJ [Virgibacillus necropolis]ASN05868.1 sporulation integral membrane protein YlbJ [Virgibacillus necropolis]